MEVEIRNVSQGDEDAVVRLWREVFPNNPPWNDPVADFQRKLSTQAELFFVAACAREIVGSVMAGYDGHRGWVYYLAVSPGHRRCGIGAALMERVELELKKRSCTKINLQVREHNTPVVAFYEALGYNVEPRISMGKLFEQ